jgi:hypothetical protein
MRKTYPCIMKTKLKQKTSEFGNTPNPEPITFKKGGHLFSNINPIMEKDSYSKNGKNSILSSLAKSPEGIPDNLLQTRATSEGRPRYSSTGKINTLHHLPNKKYKGCKCLHMTSLSIDQNAIKKYYNKKKFDHSKGIREKMPEPILQENFSAGFQDFEGHRSRLGSGGGCSRIVNKKLHFIVYPKSANHTWRVASGNPVECKEHLSEMSVNGSAGIIQSPDFGVGGGRDGFFDEFGFVNV